MIPYWTAMFAGLNRVELLAEVILQHHGFVSDLLTNVKKTQLKSRQFY
jgi:hypothetical protein